MEISAGSSGAEQSLFQGREGGSTPTPALHFIIRKIEHRDAKAWIEKWHYSHRIPTGKNISFGLFAGDSLYAVIVYGIGVNCYQARFLKVKEVVEIKRMARSEPRLDYPLSRFISISTRFLRDYMKFDAIVAFADPEHGHEGTVYKAAGYKAEGMTNPEWHVVGEDGVKRHRRFAFRHARRNGISIAESRAILKLTRVKTMRKFRWVRRFA